MPIFKIINLGGLLNKYWEKIHKKFIFQNYSSIFGSPSKKSPPPLQSAIHFSQCLSHFSDMILNHSFTASSKSPVQFPWSFLAMKNEAPTALSWGYGRGKSRSALSPGCTLNAASSIFWTKNASVAFKTCGLALSWWNFHFPPRYSGYFLGMWGPN